MGESINPTLYAWVIIKRVTVEVAELKSVPFEGGASEGCGNIDLHEGSASEGHKALKMLHKEDDVPVIHVFP